MNRGRPASAEAARPVRPRHTADADHELFLHSKDKVRTADPGHEVFRHSKDKVHRLGTDWADAHSPTRSAIHQEFIKSKPASFLMEYIQTYAEVCHLAISAGQASELLCWPVFICPSAIKITRLCNSLLWSNAQQTVCKAALGWQFAMRLTLLRLPIASTYTACKESHNSGSSLMHQA